MESKIINKVVHKSGNQFMIFCPGCQCAHAVNGLWDFNRDFDKPTFSPSILVRTGHFVPGKDNETCWCKYNADQIAKGENPSGFSCGVCHSFVTDGNIQFLSDCTHALAGQTVELEGF